IGAMVKSDSYFRPDRRDRWSWGLGRNAIGFVGPDGELDPVACAQLCHEVCYVTLDSAETHVELAGDFGVGSAAGHDEEDLLLAVGEGLAGLRGRQLGPGVGERRK